MPTPAITGAVGAAHGASRKGGIIVINMLGSGPCSATFARPHERDSRTLDRGCRRELLDHTPIWNQGLLRRILRQYETRHKPAPASPVAGRRCPAEAA